MLFKEISIFVKNLLNIESSIVVFSAKLQFLFSISDPFLGCAELSDGLTYIMILCSIAEVTIFYLGDPRILSPQFFLI